MAAASGEGGGSQEGKALVITAFGGFDKLKVQPCAVVAPGDGEVQVNLKAAGVNFAELMARVRVACTRGRVERSSAGAPPPRLQMGVYPPVKKAPTVVGYEGAGVVTAVGSGVTEYAVGGA